MRKIEDKSKQDEAYLKMKKERLLPEDRMFVGRKMNNDVGISQFSWHILFINQK